MIDFRRLLTSAFILLATNMLHSQTVITDSFDKVIISPFIEATFIESDQERVVINNSNIDPGKLRIETRNGTLRIFLEGAKEIPGHPLQTRIDDQQYSPHSVSVTVYYNDLHAISLRGEEQFRFPGRLSTRQLVLNLYGSSTVTFAEVNITDLRAKIYGESSIVMQSGYVDKQIYTCYGEGIINTVAASGREAKLTAYGEADFNINVSGHIKINSFGEASVRYKGSPLIVKGINFGGLDVARLD